MTVALVSLHLALLLGAVFILFFLLLCAVIWWDDRWEREQKEKRSLVRLERRIAEEKDRREWRKR